jgi:DtxR family Mn-dependent transcriptional regulator
VGQSAALFRDGNENLLNVVNGSPGVPVRVTIVRMSEEIQKDTQLMGTLRAAGVQPGAAVQAAVGGLGVRLGAEAGPGCEIDSEAATHLFVTRA